MRISTYEIILPLIGRDEKIHEEKKLLVNGLYGAFDVVDAEIADKLEKRDVAGIPFALRERLTVRGHITWKDDEGELADARLIGRIWNKLVGQAGIGPIILPTYDCNFRCPYCFERHRLTRGQEWLGHEMKPDMVEAVFAALQKQRDKGHKVNDVTLYGGEPLLKENKATVRNICEHARAMGLGISAVTNGYDLDEYIDILKEFDFDQLQITVDGVGEQNDCRRMHRDGVPTYDRILQNVALALDNGVSVNMRVNVNAENIGGIKALIDDLKDRGFHMASPEEMEQAYREAKEAKKTGNPKAERKGLFSYYFKAVSEYNDSPTKVTDQQVMDAIIATGIPAMDAIRKQSKYSSLMRELSAIMEKKEYPKSSPSFCGAEEGMLCIAPDGILYSCWDLVAKEEDAVGFTDMENGRFFYNFFKAKWRTRTSDLMEQCRICPYIFICSGGCASEAEKEHGSYFRESCGEIREVFAFVASRVVGRKWEETKEDELSVSLTGPLSRLTEKEREILMTSTSQKEMFEIIKNTGFLSADQVME